MNDLSARDRQLLKDAAVYMFEDDAYSATLAVIKVGGDHDLASRVISHLTPLDHTYFEGIRFGTEMRDAKVLLLLLLAEAG